MLRSPGRSIICVFGVLLCTLLLVSCGGTGNEERASEWTVAVRAVTLERDLFVREGEDFYFGEIPAVDVASDGRMYVLDWEAHHVKVLSPDGTLVDTLGQEGQGPGEFGRLESVQVARGDSIYVYDIRQTRLTVLEPASPYQISRVVTIPRKKGQVSQVHVLETHLVGQVSGGFGPPEEGIQTALPGTWRVIREDGRPGDSLFSTQQEKMAISKIEKGFRAHPVPFARGAIVQKGPNSRLYYGWTDSLHIQATSLEGTTEEVASIPADPVPVTEAERDSALEGIDTEIRRQIAAAFPETKPTFTDLIVADDGRLWVERPTVGTEEKTRWWRLDPESRTIQEVRLPSEVDLEVVQNGHAYGSTTTEAGAPAVVRYRVGD